MGNRADSAPASTLEIGAKIENLEFVQAFLEGLMSPVDIPMKVVHQVQLAVEELFVNVCHYAYKDDSNSSSRGSLEWGMIRIDGYIDEGDVRIVLQDGGIPFDPFGKDDPDITIGAEEREIGGLGIFMVKSTMDEFFYERDGNLNRITIIKKFSSA